MEPRQLFEPTLAVFLGKFGEFCVRYFLVAGGLYCLLEIAFKQTFLRYRIQQAFPPLRQIGYEIRWTLSNTACSSLSTLLIYRLVRDGHARMYFGLADYGWPYLVFSSMLFVVGYDTWLYWEHRYLHTGWMYDHVHAVHHRMGNPSAFASFAHHPIETFMGNVYFILFVVFVPIHPLAMAAAGAYMFYTAIVGHLGYEFYPRGFTRAPLLGLVNTATYHNIHHREMRCNYGAWFIYWDRLMGTERAGYHDAFESLKARVAMPAQPEALASLPGQ
jgi:sterol desaturase/sphingolipid hydroxylase (fatty acid hydroxylase superfamily)